MPAVTVVRLTGDVILKTSLEADSRVSQLLAQIAQAVKGPCQLLLGVQELSPSSRISESGLSDGCTLTAITIRVPLVFSTGLVFAAVYSSGDVISWHDISRGSTREKEQEKLGQSLRQSYISSSPAGYHKISQPSTPVALAALKADRSVVRWQMPPDVPVTKNSMWELVGGVQMYADTDALAVSSGPTAEARGPRASAARARVQQALNTPCCGQPCFAFLPLRRAQY
mmetsp:Transcript_156652/g.292345  ORF Transcript_156652/g.292345 Transcript_156652/m.292345 type:complete len:227 (-) Transcript_156652:155-835(-)